MSSEEPYPPPFPPYPEPPYSGQSHPQQPYPPPYAGQQQPYPPPPFSPQYSGQPYPQQPYPPHAGEPYPPPSYSSMPPPAYFPPQPSPSFGSNPHHVAARGFAQMFGLHPAIAFLTLIVDTMLFGSEGVAVMIGGPTVGTSIVFSLMLSCIVGGIVGIITYMAQKKWYGDDKDSALIKALILACLTAIPTNIPAFVYVPAGIVGLFRRKK